MEAGGLLPRQPPQGPPGTISVCQGPNGHTGNVPGNVLGQSAIHELNASGQLGLTGQQQLHLQQQQQQQMGQAPGMGEVLTPKRQAVVDRLRRRIESYRRRQTDCIPRFDQSFNGLCEQNTYDTQVLKQRFLESKAKRQAKKTDKKQSDSVGLSNVHMVSPLSLLLLYSFTFSSSSSSSTSSPSLRLHRRASVGVPTPLWEFELVTKLAAAILPSFLPSPSNFLTLEVEARTREALLASRGRRMYPMRSIYRLYSGNSNIYPRKPSSSCLAFLAISE